MRAWFRPGMRTLLVMIGFTCILFGWVRWQVDSYKKAWDVEQRALADMRRLGARFSASTRPIGPSWLRLLAGPERSKYLYRVDMIFFVTTDSRIAYRYRKWLKHFRGALQD